MKEELKEVMTVFGGQGKDLNLARERLLNLINACEPSADNLPLPDLLNDSIERLKELEGIGHFPNNDTKTVILVGVTIFTKIRNK